MLDTMQTVTSRDGTTIAYERTGTGPAVVLVGGALIDHSENTPLAAVLAADFTVYNYDRRGRGGSGDTLPYSRDRELEDLAAVLEVAGSAHLYGVSSGGALALHAAGLTTGRIAVYEVPYNITDEQATLWQGYTDALGAALPGDPGAAVEAFMRLVGTPDDDLAAMRTSPYWPGLEAVGHTLAYDAAFLDGGRPPAEFATITRQTLVLTGVGSDPHMPGVPIDFFGTTADALTAVLPNATRETIPGGTHEVDATALAPVLTRFYLS